MRKICVAIIKPKSLHYNEEHSYLVNPGLGGTEFLTLRLYHELKNEMHLKLYLLDDSDFLSCIDTGETQPLDQYDKIISARAYLHNVDTNKFGKKLIVWSHHPFDALKNHLKNTLVSLSEFQFLSNESSEKVSHIIPNYFDNPNTGTGAVCNFSSSKILFMGALIPTKGIEQVLTLWSSAQMANDFSLNVIGSGDLYDHLRTASSLKEIQERSNESYGIENAVLKRRFQNRMEKKISTDLTFSGSVKYWGKLNRDRFRVFESSFCAIFNPSGKSEAFPASILEFLSFGIPVITTSNFGNSEFMRFFPEVVCTRVEDIPKKIRQLKRSPHLYKAISERALSVAKFYSNRNKEINQLWKSVIAEEDTITDLRSPTVTVKIKHKSFYRIKNFLK